MMNTLTSRRFDGPKTLWVILAAFLAASGSARADLGASTSKPQDASKLLWEHVAAESSDAGFRKTRGNPQVFIEADTWTTVRVPRDTVLRLWRQDTHWQGDEVALWVGDGSGVAMRQKLVPSADGRSLLWAPDPLGPSQVLARVESLVTGPQPLEIGISLGRWPEATSSPKVRRPIEPASADGVALSSITLDDGITSAPRRYLALEPDRPWQFHVRGPQLVDLTSRLRYPTTASRSAEAYRLEVRLNDQPLTLLEHETRPERGRLEVVMEGDSAEVGPEASAPLLSRRERDTIRIPEGDHQLEIAASAPVYLRLSALEEPFLMARNRRLGSALPPIVSLPSLWSLDEPFVLPATTAETELLALRLGRDNRHREGGLAGLELLRSRLPQGPLPPAPEEAEIARAARRFDLQHTFYRDLLPVRGAIGASPRWAYARSVGVSIASEANPHPAQSPRVIAEQFLGDRLRQMMRGIFLTPTSGATQAMVYLLPRRSADSRLRLLVAPASCRDEEMESCAATQHRLRVQLDDQKPLLLRVFDDPLSERTAAPGSSDATLRALAWQSGDPEGSTLSGPFSRWLPSAPRLLAGVFEVPLPASVRQVRVWSEEPNPAQVSQRPPGLALQMETAGAFRLSEFAWLAATDASASTPSRTLADLHERELANHRVPLERLLAARAEPLRLSVDAKDLPPARASLAPAEEERLLQLARELTERPEPQWLAALEIWNRLVHEGSVGARRVALHGRVAALQASGESFLAERQLRAMLLQTSDAELRKSARAQLIEWAEREGDWATVQGVWALAFLEEPTPQVSRGLAAALFASGDHQAALQVVLEAGTGYLAPELVLEAALQLGWWQVFEQRLATLDAAERQYWQGQRAVRFGRLKEASEHFQAAGTKGEPWVAAIESGRAIRHRLIDAEVDVRRCAVVDWREWQDRHPGPRRWRSEPSTLTAFDGAARLYAAARDLHSLYARATPEQPVELTLEGPVRLRLEIRPIHAGDSVGDSEPLPLDDWLLVSSSGLTERLPIDGNLPATGLEPAEEDATWRPGRRVVEILDVGPGRHVLSLSAERSEILIRSEVERPAMPLGILPPLTPETLAHFVEGWKYEGITPDVGLLKAQKWADTEPALWVLPSSGGPLQLLHGPSAAIEIQMASAEISVIADRSEVCDPGTSRLHDRDSIPAFRLSGSDAEPRRRMAALVALAETDPAAASRALAEAAALFRQHPDVPGLRQTFARLRRGAGWAQVGTFASGAGLRRLEVDRGRESPSVRLRSALRRPLAEGEVEVLGGDRLVLSLRQARTTAFELELAQADIEFLPPQPLVARYQLRGQELQEVVLRPDGKPEQRRLEIPAGDQLLEVWIEAPLVNQSLRVRLHEDDGTSRPIAGTRPKDYLVATHDQPIRLPLPGPAMLRIDELQVPSHDSTSDSMTLSRYVFLEQDWQTHEIRPVDGADEALVRIFRLDRDPAWRAETGRGRTASVAPRRIEAQLRPVPPPQRPGRRDVTSAQRVSTPRLALSDLPNRSTPPATWSLETGWRQRRPLEEDVTRADADRFNSFEIGRRSFLEPRQTYLHGFLESRVRSGGEATLALRGIAWHRLKNRPLSLQLAASGFYQDVAGGAWSLRFDASISHFRRLGARTTHAPRLRLFVRELSLDPSEASELRGSEVIDQDVFTPYKFDHRSGLRLSDTLTWQPWLDSELWGRLTLTTNENLIDPDHSIVRGGWRQQLGRFQLGVDLRWITFFRDDDRRRSASRTTWNVEGLWQPKSGSSGWWQVGGALRYDVDTGTTSGHVFLSLHRDRGRGIRDFRPGEIDFANLYRRHAAGRNFTKPSQDVGEPR